MSGNDQKAIDYSSAVPGIPSWMGKMRSRYDQDEDIQFSLPSADDGAFLSLHFGYAEESEPRKSTFDRINEELASSKGGSGGITLGISPSRNSSGLCLTAELQQYSLREEIENPRPKSPVEARCMQPVLAHKSPIYQFQDSDDDEDDNVSPITSQLVNHNISSTKDLHNKSSGSSDRLAESLHMKLTAVAENKNLGILSTVKSYFQKTTPVTPVSSPHHSPKAVRKISAPASPHIKPKELVALEDKEFIHQGAIVQERKKMNYNAFFYRPEQDKVKLSPQTPMTDAKTVSHGSSTLSPPNKDTNASAPGSPSAGQYKPKPSRLREMNFWAPTSM